MEASDNYYNLTTESVNITNSSLRSEEMEKITIAIYEYLYKANFASSVFYYILLLIILIFGPFLCVTIVVYENFGSDRQKRTIINRLSSHVFSNIAINSFIWSILRIIRDNVGLLSHSLTASINSLSAVVWISSTFFITELVIFRFLYIVVWRRMKEINDEFWHYILLLSNILISITFAVGNYLCGHTGYDKVMIVDVFQKDHKR